jgi:threonine/homoserine efflux transporter RhtA
MATSAQNNGSANFITKRTLHQVRMVLPTFAIVVGMWLLHQNYLGANMAGIALVVGGTWDL